MFSKIGKKCLVVLCCFVFLVCGCGQQKASGEKLNVTVTVFPIYDFVRAVGGDLVDITLLIKPGAEIHSFDPKPSDIVAVENADLFIKIGGESEEWAEKIGASEEKTVKMMDCVKLISEEGHHDEYDEHIWTSHSNAVLMIEKICERLTQADPENAEKYKANALKYIGKIEEVSEKTAEVVEKSQSKFILVADRFPFAYFASEYGLNYAAAFGGCAVSTDISVKVMNTLVGEIKEKNCKAVFYIEMSDKKIAQALSEETGVKLLELHSAHNVTLDDFKSGITYIDIIKNNLDSLERGIA
ncbi:MAG: zinc ABC transporter substrate-binding protein [Clostridia bacterium]|nr:zinc ABC transporter substrate-binding protein [Clostridia bacterium]